MHPEEAARSKPRSSRLIGVEAGRGIAAIFVVLLHAGAIVGGAKSFGRTPFGPLFSFGHAGVDFFFVLSGFVILFAHLKDVNRPARIGVYFSRRLTRIFPPYWVACSIMLAVFFFSPSHTGRETALSVVLRSYLLIPQPDGPLLTVAWSLQNEMLFYLFFALLILNRRIGLIAFAVWAAGIAGFVIAGISPKSYDTAFTVFTVLNLDFFMGMFAAYLLSTRSVTRWPILLTAGALTYTLTAAAEVAGFLRGPATPTRLLYGLGSMLLIIGIAEGERSGRIRVAKVMAVLGSASYSIYLVHVPALLLIDQAVRALGLPRLLPAEAAYLLYVAAAVSIAVLFSRYIEFPLLEAARRRVRAFTGVAPQPPVPVSAAAKGVLGC